MNRNRKRVMAGAMAVVMTAGGIGAYEYQGAGTEVMAEEGTKESLEAAANAVLEGKEDNSQKASGNTGKDSFKEESVYVKADTAGNVSSATVTEWLKNPESGDFADISGLKDIQNIKGEEEFSKGSGDEITWKSEGSDIYYQGTTDEKLPVNVNISYKLDGKELKAEDLAGKDGKVEIHIDYENRSKEKVEIDGEKVEMYTPFTMVTSMMLPTDEYTNVEIDNGKIMSDADKNIVVGLGFPGLSENLKLKALDLDIPESVTITADVKDASVGPTITVASAEIMEEFDLSDVHDFDSLEASIHELEEASEKLEEGSKEASDGAAKLADGAKEAASGAKELEAGTKEAASGAKELEAGTKEAASGAKELEAGTKEAASGAKELEAGTKEAADGAKALADGSKTLSAGVSELSGKSGVLAEGIVTLSEGVKMYTSGVGELEAASKQLEAGANELSGGTDTLKSGIDAAYNKAAELAGGCSALRELIGGTGSGAAGMAGYLKTADGALTRAQDVLAGVDTSSGQYAVTGTSDAAAVISQMTDGEISAADIQAVIDSYVEAVSVERADPSADISYAVSELYEAQNAIYAAQGTAGGLEDSAQFLEAVNQLNVGAQNLMVSLGGTDGTGGLKGGAVSIAEGISNLSAGISGVSEGATKLNGKSSQLVEGANQLKEGGPQLIAGINALESGAKELASKTDILAAGNQKLWVGANALHSGNQKLADGAGALFSGNQKLADGALALADGNQKLFVGAGALSDGNQKLSDGAGALADGNQKLSDGMSEFKTSGIDKLTEVFDNDIQSVRTRIDTMSDLGKNYKSFGGIKDGMSGSTKFIIETEGVEK